MIRRRKTDRQRVVPRPRLQLKYLHLNLVGIGFSHHTDREQKWSHIGEFPFDFDVKKMSCLYMDITTQ